MKRESRFFLLLLSALLIYPAGIGATLVDRGQGLIYDNVLNITWLQDANLAASETFGVDGISPEGRMTWYTAMTWIAAMNAANYLGYSDWRLPTIDETILAFHNSEMGYAGPDPATGQYGYNWGFNMVNSEMGCLYYESLGNLGFYALDGTYPQDGWGLVNTGPFVNLRGNDVYWSSEFSRDPGLANAWVFAFSSGIQGGHTKYDGTISAWAVRSGDVAAPAPGLLRAISSLQVISGLAPQLIEGRDISDDGKIGLVEAIYALQTEAKLRHSLTLHTIGSQLAEEGSPLCIILSASDLDGYPFYFTAENLPEGASLNASTGRFSWIPTHSQCGIYQITFMVTNACGSTDSELVTIKVKEQLPSASPTAYILEPNDLSTHVLGTPIQFSGKGIDPIEGLLEDYHLSWSSNLDGEIGIGSSFSTSALTEGTHLVTLTVGDEDSLTASQNVLIRVTNQSIEVYPPAHPSRLSDLYLVEVNKDGDWVSANAYKYTRKSEDPSWHYGSYPSVHWTTIGLSDQATASIRVTRLNRSWGNAPFTSVDILPSRYNIVPSWNSDIITFDIVGNQKAYIRTNNQDYDTLFIFAAPLKPPVPPCAKYFAPGIHHIGVAYQLSPIERDIYLDGGAWVVGSIDIRNAGNNVRIIGPGVLSGEFEIWENIRHLDTHETWHETFPYMMIHTGLGVPPSFDLLIEGITIVGSPYYNIAIYGLNGSKSVDNVHIISPWTCNTDGINTGSKGHIANSFVFNNDDTIHAEYIFDGNIIVNSCVFAGRNPFLIGYGYWGSGEPYKASISDIDLILQYPREPFRAEVDGKSSDIIVDNQTYENITIDGNVSRLAYLIIEDTPWGAPTPAKGNIRNIIFRDVTLKGKQLHRSILRGKDANNRIDNIVFENLIIDGIHVTNDNCDEHFDIDRNTVSIDFR